MNICNKLCTKDIFASYAGKNVIENINISVGIGEIVSLVGRSGVGKTTLFEILAGLNLPDSGDVFLNNECVTGQSGKVGYMLQRDLLLPYKTVAQNVALPIVIRGEKSKTAQQKVLPYFERFGLSGYENSYPYQLSGGMKQRAALLRAYLFGGDVMLLDEPFSALDAITRADMRGWFSDLAKNFNLTALLITHDIEEAVILSDRVYVMSGLPGQIAAEIKLPENRDISEFKETITQYL